MLIMYARRNIHHRNLWSVESLTPADIRDVIDTARQLWLAQGSGQAMASLRGRHLALLNDAAPQEDGDGLRPAALGLGAKVSHVRPSDARISSQNTDEATARLLGLLYDAIDCEGMAPEQVAEVARQAGVPVFNGLGSTRHPTRVLAELLAMHEHTGKALDMLSVRFVGDPISPCGEALLRAAAALGIELRIASPRDRWPPPELWESLKAAAVAGGERLRLFESAEQAGEDSDVTVEARNDPPWPLAMGDWSPPEDERRSYRQATLQAMLLAAIN
jgi:ornithine carbamoyltransferase